MMKKILYFLMTLLLVANVQAAGIMDILGRGFQSIFYVTMQIPHPPGVTSSYPPTPVILIIFSIAAIMALIWAILEGVDRIPSFLKNASKNIKIVISLTIALIAVYGAPIVEQIFVAITLLGVGFGIFAILGSLILIVAIIFWLLGKAGEVGGDPIKTAFKVSGKALNASKNFFGIGNKKRKKSIQNLANKFESAVEGVERKILKRPAGFNEDVVDFNEILINLKKFFNDLSFLKYQIASEKPIGLSVADQDGVNKLWTESLKFLDNLHQVLINRHPSYQELVLKKKQEELIESGVDEEKIKSESSKMFIEINRVKEHIDKLIREGESVLRSIMSNPRKVEEFCGTFIKEIDRVEKIIGGEYANITEKEFELANLAKNIKKEKKEKTEKEEKEEKVQLVAGIGAIINTKQLKLNGTSVSCRVNSNQMNLQIEFPVSFTTDPEAIDDPDPVQMTVYGDAVDFRFDNWSLEELKNLTSVTRRVRGGEVSRFRNWCIQNLIKNS